MASRRAWRESFRKDARSVASCIVRGSEGRAPRAYATVILHSIKVWHCIDLTNRWNVAPQANMGCEQCEQAIYLLEEPNVELYDGTSKARA